VQAQAQAQAQTQLNQRDSQNVNSASNYNGSANSNIDAERKGASPLRKNRDRPKLQISDIHPNIIKKAHVDRIRQSDRFSMIHMVNLLKKQRVNDNKLFQ
jgi:hypothetical protein